MCFAFCVSALKAQSTRIEAPTPITTNEINGRISARDVGDSRLTTYYYVFSGNQGDIFLKIESSNLNGDIDIFYADNLRPLTKVSVYADSSATQTGREIYLRKPEKLILRVEGRSPNDDAATFSIKFDGSFQAAATDISTGNAVTPTLKNEVAGAVRVNSVGTIIETPAKAEPEETIAKTPKKTSKKTTSSENISTADEISETEKENLNRKRVVVSENPPESADTEKNAAKTTAAKNRPPARRAARTTAKKTIAKPPAERKTPIKTAVETKTEELATALENVRLVVLLKDGGKIDRPMSEILRFSVDKGTLTIIAKNGSISRFSILDITKVSIE